MKLAPKLRGSTLAEQIAPVLLARGAASTDDDDVAGGGDNEVVGREAWNFEFDQHCMLGQIDICGRRVMCRLAVRLAGH